VSGIARPLQPSVLVKQNGYHGIAWLGINRFALGRVRNIDGPTTTGPSNPSNSMTKAIPKTSKNNLDYDILNADSNSVGDLHHDDHRICLLLAAAGMPCLLMQSEASAQRIPAQV
jgi:hypothetical protein